MKLTKKLLAASMAGIMGASALGGTAVAVLNSGLVAFAAQGDVAGDVTALTANSSAQGNIGTVTKTTGTDADYTTDLYYYGSSVPANTTAGVSVTAKATESDDKFAYQIGSATSATATGETVTDSVAGNISITIPSISSATVIKVGTVANGETTLQGTPANLTVTPRAVTFAPSVVSTSFAAVDKGATKTVTFSGAVTGVDSTVKLNDLKAYVLNAQGVPTTEISTGTDINTKSGEATSKLSATFTASSGEVSLTAGSTGAGDDGTIKIALVKAANSGGKGAKVGDAVVAGTVAGAQFASTDILATFDVVVSAKADLTPDNFKDYLQFDSTSPVTYDGRAHVQSVAVASGKTDKALKASVVSYIGADKKSVTAPTEPGTYSAVVRVTASDNVKAGEVTIPNALTIEKIELAATDAGKIMDIPVDIAANAELTQADVMGWITANDKENWTVTVSGDTVTLKPVKGTVPNKYYKLATSVEAVTATIDRLTATQTKAVATDISNPKIDQIKDDEGAVIGTRYTFTARSEKDTESSTAKYIFERQNPFTGQWDVIDTTGLTGGSSLGAGMIGEESIAEVPPFKALADSNGNTMSIIVGKNNTNTINVRARIDGAKTILETNEYSVWSTSYVINPKITPAPNAQDGAGPSVINANGEAGSIERILSAYKIDLGSIKNLFSASDFSRAKINATVSKIATENDITSQEAFEVFFSVVFKTQWGQENIQLTFLQMIILALYL